MNLPRQREVANSVYYTGFIDRDDDYRVIFYNFNVTAADVRNLMQRQQVLEKIHTTVNGDFGFDAEIFFAVTATFWLIHSETNQRVEWVGNFYANFDNNPSVIQDFKAYQSDTFVVSSFDLLNHVENILTLNGKNSKWTFESLQSVIFNFQARVLKNHDVINKRLIQFNNRRQQSFQLF
jgi:hypothetical protein